MTCVSFHPKIEVPSEVLQIMVDFLFIMVAEPYPCAIRVEPQGSARICPTKFLKGGGRSRPQGSNLSFQKWLIKPRRKTIDKRVNRPSH